MRLLTHTAATRHGAEAEAARLLGRLLGVYTLASLALAGLAQRGHADALLPLASCLLALAGLSGTTAMALARARVAALEGAAPIIGRAARRPQAALVPILAIAAIACAWLSLASPAPAPSGARWLLAACAASAFALLVAERTVAAQPTGLPEASALSRLLLVPVVVIALDGLLLAARAAGLPWTQGAAMLLALAIAAIAAELALRGLARWFLPPPPGETARAAVDSLLLRATRNPAAAGLAAPLRDHFGLDFSRSWALAYARAAVLPLILVLMLGCWLLSGVVVVQADARAVAERFGAPVGVLTPGLHAILPWPLGRAVPVEFGIVHEATLAATGTTIDTAGAEAAAPPSADRLWEKAHPAELLFLIASQTAGHQSFQIVSADIRVLYRIGLSDADATRSVLATADPATLVRSASGRAVAASLAGLTLAQVLGPRRDTLSAALRQAAQAELDRLGTGLEIVAMVIEAIHPPPGAADAYHRVQAAEIAATTTIATERGRAQAALALAGQQAATELNTARAAAAEQRLAASTEEVRFTADRAASQAGGRAFLLERSNEDIVAALAGTPKTILDQRLGAGERTVIDLRPFLPAAPAARDD